MQPHRPQPPYPPQQPYRPPQWRPAPRPPHRTPPAVIALAVAGGVLALLLLVGGAMALITSGQEQDTATPPAATTAAAEPSRAAYLVETDNPKNQAAYQAALDKIHPTLGAHSDKSLFNDGRNTCGDIAKGEDEASILSRVKFRYQRDDVTVNDTLAKRIFTEAIPKLCPATAG